MSGITTGTGIFSGINTAQLIDQLIQADSGPKMLAQQRVLDLQVQQAAWLDLNSKVQALQTAAGAFRLNKVFQTNKATSSDQTVLSATASNTAVPGSYQFVVDRLVSTQQYLSRGFANSTSTGLNAGAFTFESAQARLDRDTSLADLNGGDGIARGKIVITDATNNQSATVDLSRAGSVQDVLDAINGTAGINVRATVQGGQFVLTSSVGGNISVTNAFGSTTATSLGIERGTASSTSITGSQVYSLGDGSALSSLNDGNGVTLNSQTGNARFDLTITVNGTPVNINLGDKYNADGTVSESAPTTLGGVLTRINDQLQATLGDNHVQASIGSDGVSLALNDSDGRSISVAENTTAGSHTAADLGLLTSSPQVGTVLGQRILAGLNTTLAHSLNGGSGVSGDGSISITGHDGTVRTVNVNTSGSLQDILDAFNNDPSHAFSASLNQDGTGIKITDLTSGSSNLIISGATATSLGIATVPAGVTAASVTGTNLQHQYITTGTLLSSLNNGQGIGTGSFSITDSNGTSATVNIDSTATTLDDVIRNINSRGTRIQARINDKGDGIELYESATGGGANKISVSDTSGTVAASLNIAGTAAGTGTQNILDGSYEKTVTFAATDTLQQMADKINSAGVGVTAGIISDGAGSTPYRLSLTSKFSGSAGRFVVDTGSFDLGATQLDDGHDARVFYGSSDPARGILLSSSQNTLDNVISGVSIDLNGLSATGAATTLTVSRDTDAIDTAVNTFVSAFNTLTSSITDKTKYDQNSDTKGPLLGDSTALQVQSSLFNTVEGTAIGVTGPFQRFSDVGITIGDGGQLQLDETKFRAALQQNPQAVADLFSARVQDTTQTGTINGVQGVTFTDPNAQPTFSTLGLGSRIELLAQNMLDPVNGTLTQVNNTLTSQVDLQNQRITDLQAHLDNERTVLQQQFLAMEQAIGQLQQQQQSISQIGG